MKLITTVLAGSILFGVCCTSAQAYHYRRPAYGYNAQEVGRQQRANMAERTHQAKELMEFSRLNDERKRISAASTITEYPPASKRKKMRKRSNTALVESRRDPNSKL